MSSSPDSAEFGTIILFGTHTGKPHPSYPPQIELRGGGQAVKYVSIQEFDAAVAEVDASVTAKCMDRVAEARAAAFEEAAKLLDAEQGTWLPNAPFGSAICAALKEYAKKIRAGGGE